MLPSEIGTVPGLQPTAEVPIRALYAATALLLLAALVFELRTSAVQSSLLSRYVATLTFEVQPGPSPALPVAEGGPFDQARGYTRLPDFERRLLAARFRVTEQARVSPEMAWLMRHGITPPYPEPSRTGLLIRDQGGAVVHDAVARGYAFARLEDVPEVVIRSLLFVENRELADPPDPRANPALEWDRLAHAVLLYAAGRFGLSLPVQGGSTLATQIEKYRHSPRGRTGTPTEKLRQIAAASLRAYQHGVDTRPERRAIILDYLNSMPLAAAAGWGEVHGMGDGLWAWFGLDARQVTREVVAADPAVRARALKHVLALVCAVRAPSQYLVANRGALEARADAYARLLAAAGVLDPQTAHRIVGQPLAFVGRAPAVASPDPRRWKATNAVRNDLLDLLRVRNYSELDALHLEVESTLDLPLQDEVAALLQRLRDPRFVDQQKLRQERLLQVGDPADVHYSVLLFERTPAGNLLRVQADTLEQALDLNRGMMLELGSTAKLRTLAHYLGIVARLHRELSPDSARRAAAGHAEDPITRWAVDLLDAEPALALDRQAFLERALDRRYSASPAEMFLTGGGNHHFVNFDPLDNGRVLTVREATWKSTNLVFVRLMRDLVLYHTARLPYDAFGLLRDTRHPDRRQLLQPIAAAEGDWIKSPRQRRAQDTRLRIRIERDAFAAMTAGWRRLGFPFPRLVPSLATALGCSGDRPEALAELMSILMNDGRLRPALRVRRLRFAADTPYETVMDSPASSGEQVMDPAVARTLRRLIAGVVERGTARRVAGVFKDAAGRALPVGGKTGSGDNRSEKVDRHGNVLRSTPRNRTATFVFYVGDHLFGVVTAYVAGRKAGEFRFTSALPVTVLKLIAPVLEKRLGSAPAAAAPAPAATAEPAS